MDVMSLVIDFLISYIGLSVGTVIRNKTRLNKLNKYKGSIISDIGPINEFKDNKSQKGLDNNVLKLLLPFIEKLKLYIKDENLNTLRNNLISLKINRNNLGLLLGSKGSYITSENKLTYALESSLGHEFLHLSSSYYDEKNKISYSGFCQRNLSDGVFIGVGINEGYTELLSSRIFNKDNKVHSYKKNVVIAKLLECFFDDPKEMEDLYFNYSLPGLIHHLEKYAKRDEIIKFITEIDTMNSYAVVGNPFSDKRYLRAVGTLTRWSSDNMDVEKRKRFNRVLYEENLSSFITLRKRTKLQKDSPYNVDKSFSSDNRLCV